MALAMNQYQRKRNAMTLTKALGILGYESWSALDKGELDWFRKGEIPIHNFWKDYLG